VRKEGNHVTPVYLPPIAAVSQAIKAMGSEGRIGTRSFSVNKTSEWVRKGDISSISKGAAHEQCQ